MEIKVSSNAAQVIDSMKVELDAYQKQMQFTLFRALTLLEAEIMQNIRVNSGLQVRSGALLNSISGTKKVTVNTNTGELEGEIGTEGVPYAAIQEFGGITRPHVILPRNSSVLAFLQNGNQVFSKGVNHPGSNIPARPFLRPALAAKREEIINTFGLFLKASFSTE
jgi:HK97 gp10 family phage protein